MIFLAGVPALSPAAHDVSILDLVELELGYTTLSEQYYRQVKPQVLLDGARTGIVAYLRGRGVAAPQVAFMHARPDGRGAVPAIEQQVGKAIERYGSRVDVRQLVYNTIRGEAAALRDPYTVFFTKAQMDGFRTALDGASFGGIGIVLARDDAAGAWRVDQVFEGSPAARAGLEPGDRIAAVDGEPAGGLSSEELRAQLRGKIGTVVHLSVTRGGSPLPQPLALVRASITPPEVTARMLSGNVGYVALRIFGERAGEDVRAAAERLEARGAKALVFDLRNDGGGYESAAVKVAGDFIASGPLVAVAENHGKRRVTMAGGGALPPRPLAVLVNHDSASGSELVAAALQDRGLGKLVGTRTFGKGLVQTIVPLPDGAALKVTTARYFTPNGRDIDGIGVIPDDVVDEPADAELGVPGRDPQLDRALTLLSAEE
ncbi:MAG: S41 family peptidase [Candidatus Baltobacteraceae bacterium]